MTRITRRDWLGVTAAALAAGAGGPGSAAEDDGMVLIPGGPFIMGTDSEEAEALAREHGYHPSWFSGEVPRRTVEVSTFLMDRFPVTNADYHAFCEATGYPTPPHWQRSAPTEKDARLPVMFVNKADAETYARWVGKRLPTEAEWEKAARGTDGRVYPWGDGFERELCNWNRDPRGGGARLIPVDALPGGASPYGVMDLVGNLAEWCADERPQASSVIKGGCWRHTQVVNLRPAGRTMSGASNNRTDFYGFRCARDA